MKPAYAEIFLLACHAPARNVGHSSYEEEMITHELLVFSSVEARKI